MKRPDLAPVDCAVRWLTCMGSVSSLILILGLAGGCQTSCRSDGQPILWADGISHTSPSGVRVYESTALDSEWLLFAAGRHFVLEHDLDTLDYTWQAYVAFNARPLHSSSDASADMALASGDIVVVDKLEKNVLQVHNTTCSEEYLYVRITAPGAGGDAGSSSATSSSAPTP